MIETYMKIYALGFAVLFLLGFVVLTARSVAARSYAGDSEIPIWFVGSLIWPLTLYIGLWFAVGLGIGEFWDWYTANKWIKEQEEQ